MYGWGGPWKKISFFGQKKETIQCVGALPFLYINCIISKIINLYAYMVPMLDVSKSYHSVWSS